MTIEIVTSKNGNQYIVLPCAEGTFENEDFEVLITRRDPIQDAVNKLDEKNNGSVDLVDAWIKSTNNPKSSSNTDLEDKVQPYDSKPKPEFLDYVPVRVLAYTGRPRVTGLVHAAERYTNDTYSYALCDASGTRSVRRVRGMGSTNLKAVSCSRCKKHLAKAGQLPNGQTTDE